MYLLSLLVYLFLSWCICISKKKKIYIYNFKRQKIQVRQRPENSRWLWLHFILLVNEELRLLWVAASPNKEWNNLPEDIPLESLQHNLHLWTGWEKYMESYKQTAVDSVLFTLPIPPINPIQLPRSYWGSYNFSNSKKTYY